MPPTTTTASLPAAELRPFMVEALERARAVSHSFSVRDTWRLADAAVRESGDSRVVHPQTLRKLMNDDPAVSRRLAHASERPDHVSRNTKLYLYSLDRPVPAWDSDLSREFERQYPAPRETPPARGTRSRRKLELPVKSRAVEFSGRAELICTLVTELVADVETSRSSSVIELERQLEDALANAERLSTENTKLKRQMKAVERAAKLLDFAADSA